MSSNSLSSESIHSKLQPADSDHASGPARTLTVADGYKQILALQKLFTLGDLFEVPSDGSLNKPGLDSWRERVRLRIDIEGQQRVFYLKRFSNPPSSARREVRRSRSGARSVAGVEWAWLCRLANDGIACAEAVAFGEQFSGSTELRSAVLIAEVEGESLETWASRWRESDQKTIRQLIQPLAQLVSRMHGRGYFHRDLYLCHVFFDPEAEVQDSLCMIDLQRMIKPAWGQRRWVAKDLAALNYSTPEQLVSNTDRIRWFRSYLGLERLNAPARQLLYRVVGKTRQIARHQARREKRWSKDQS